MLFGLYGIVVVAVVAALPYVVFAVRRLYLASRLKTVCRQKGYILIPLKRLWWLDTVKSGDCACKIETEDTCYAIKIIGTVSHRQYLRFMDETHIAVRSLRLETHMTAKAVGYTYKEKEPYRFGDVTADKRVFPVLLLHPTPTVISVKRTDTSGEKAVTASYLTPKSDAPKRDELLQNGDFTGEGYVYTVKNFLNRI